MKTISTTIVLFITGIAFSQTTDLKSYESLPTIAVYQPKVAGISGVTPEMAGKMLRIEVSKLNTYILYDEFDMLSVLNQLDSVEKVCLDKQCLLKLGDGLEVDYIVSGSYDRLGDKIVVFLKLISLEKRDVVESKMLEFDASNSELQRMTEVVIRQMHNIETKGTQAAQLLYDKDPVTSYSAGQINNSGPRLGYAYFMGNMQEFAMRDESRGGMEIFPAATMIGYQLETQYLGSENFSALFEGIFNITGLDQGVAIPSITLMNGFRFGQGGWEIAFGPGFGIRKRSNGFFDSHGLFGNPGTYFSQNDWNSYASRAFAGDSSYYNSNNNFVAPDPSDLHEDYDFDSKYLDKRGRAELATTFVFAFGRTFRAGSLNIPVNIFYSAQKGGGFVGVNLGFNVMKSKRSRQYK